ncbi:MAG: hypothetical protein JWO03_2952 [Bacteroidetes bacterium]|nr:hypothetical protein [Bacteroidota bacterium]
MIKHVLLFACCLFSACTFAQSLSPQVLATAGAYSLVGNYSLSYTVGEMAAVQTLSAGGTILTQGFQQPNDITIGLLEINQEANGTFVVYPIPATDNLWFGYEFDDRGEVEVSLHDITGRLLGFSLRENYSPGKVVHSFDCTPYAAGNYVLTAKYTSHNGQVKTMSKKFQIIN